MSPFASATFTASLNNAIPGASQRVAERILAFRDFSPGLKVFTCIDLYIKSDNHGLRGSAKEPPQHWKGSIESYEDSEEEEAWSLAPLQTFFRCATRF